MELTEIIEQYKLYREIAVRIDLITIGINLCVLLVLFLQTKRVDKRLKQGFIMHIAIVIILLLTEIVSWTTMFNVQYLTLYKIMVTSDYILYLIMPITTFQLIHKIIEHRVHINKTFYTIYYSLFFCCALLLLIPQFRDLILHFNDEIVGYSLTPVSKYYFLAEIVLVAVGIGIGLKNAKKIGVVDTVIVLLFLSIPVVTLYIDYWWASTIGMLFMSFTILLLIGLTYQKRLTQERDQKAQRLVELADTKTKLLLSQIQPHFLYNTLTTLKFLCETEPRKAASLCDSFSGYLRANIDAADDDGLVPFEKELANIENYLKIEKARFDDRVQYVFDIHEKDFAVPVLSIQTIVENAVKKRYLQKNGRGNDNGVNKKYRRFRRNKSRR